MTALLNLASRPLAVTFTATAPAGDPASRQGRTRRCAYWKQAAEARCSTPRPPIITTARSARSPTASHSPPGRAKELEDVVSTMVGLQYIRMEEVGALPRRTAPFQVAVYAPLAETPAPPDVVLVRGPRAPDHAGGRGRARGRDRGRRGLDGPAACAVIPAVLGGPTGVTSLGCIGNRVTPAWATTSFYFTIPGPKIGEVVERLQTVVDRQPRARRSYHEGRRGQPLSRAASLTPLPTLSPEGRGGSGYNQSP